MEFGQMLMPAIPASLFHDMVHIVPGTSVRGNGGQYIKSPSTRESFRGRVMPVTNKDLMYAPAGMYTAESVKLYTEGVLLKTGDKIEDTYDGAVYTITQVLDHQDIHPLKRYIMERKGATST